MELSGGCEWMVEAHGCDPSALKDLPLLAGLFREIIRDLGLHPVTEPAWHSFPGAGGVTGMTMLSESHLTCHTFPEFQSICLNLFCCRLRPDWNFNARLRAVLGATSVSVRRIDRPYQLAGAP
ncbi:MAG: S-adenosylmethionine decarboxylase [Bryobacteraceae bacterium]